MIKLSDYSSSSSVFCPLSSSPAAPIEMMRSAVSSISTLRTPEDCSVDDEGISSSASFDDQRMNVTALLTDCGVDMEAPDAIAEQTKGIIFLSVPHRGNQSMMFLYHFPMVFALTPEAKQLQQSKFFFGFEGKHELKLITGQIFVTSGELGKRLKGA